MQSSLSRRALQLGPRLRALHTPSQLHTHATGLPASVRIVEVGPRDGLQNEASPVPASVKLQLIHQLYQAGLRSIEAGAFVSPKWVPQMADSDQVLQALGAKQAQSHYEGATFSALTPNLQGLRAALQLGVREVAVFGAASESFSKKNINCSIEESLDRFEPVCKAALSEDVRVRGYVSCVLGCPYEGAVSPKQVSYVTQRLLDMGCYEVSLGDTIGTGAAGSTGRLLEYVLQHTDVQTSQLAVHFHDTYGQ
ncbi:hypothetical protein B484DRAFT_337530, partial [Ochromonadaceae sp. CCMP2298]